MVLHFYGGYRTATEYKFLEQVEDELAKFQTTCKPNSVLVFPPLGACYRYFIHQLVGLGTKLQTVSIGQGRQRRTVVYFASGRATPEMEQSPLDTQRTFFGRGRGRRTRRPDQALYVPGALRQAKHEQQEQNLSTESPINRGGNINLSTNNTRAATEGVESAISTFTASDGTDCKNIDNRSGQNCETQTVKSLQDSKPVSKRIVDVTEGTGSISSDAHEQHVIVKSHCTSVQRLVNENKEVNRENMAKKDGDQTALKELKNELVVRKANSTMVLVEETPNASHIRDERQERDISIVKTERNASNKQILEAESSNNEIKHAFDDHRIGNLQVCTCVVSYDREPEKALTAVHENCGASNDKPLNDDKSVTEQNHEIKWKTNCKTNPIKELNLKQDGPSLEECKDLMVNEKKLDDGKESKLTGDIKVKADHSPEISVVYNSGCDGREKVGHGENCTESKLVQVHCAKSEGSEALAMLSSAFDHKGEQAKNKAITHEHSMQTAFSHGEMTLECRDPNSGLLLQTGKLLAKFDDLKTCGDDSSNQHRAANGHNQGLIENVVKHCEENTSMFDLTADQSKTVKEGAMKEAGLKTPQVASRSADKNIAYSVNDHEVISDILDSTCSNDDRKLESQINDCSVLVTNSDTRTKESEVALEIMVGKNQAVSDKTEGGSNSAFSEGNQNGDELQTELQKTSKKKKSKKDRSKDQKDDKTKCKEKGEKKKKKEKKSVKTEKSDKEQVLDLEGKIKEGRKSKTKVSTKEQNEKDLNIGVKGSDSRNDDGDDWESIFDESGDCLNPEHSEELSRLTGIENPEIHKTQFDYYSFTPREVELDDEEFGHIVEIYNFSSELKTQDLMQALSSFRSKGFDIKWVDDTHALGIFSSHITAQEAIRLCSSPLMKLRPVSRGTPESKRKATNCFEFLQPYKERPKTSKLLADRLVTGALGMRSKMTREERVKERAKLKEAKDKKQQEKIQKAQIWGD